MEIELSRLALADVPVQGEVRLSDGAPEGGGRSLAAEGVRFPEPFRVDAVARRVDGGVLVEGRVEGRVSLECGRCLRPVEQPIDSSFTARFAPPGAAVPAAGDGDDDKESGELAGDDLEVSALPEGATALAVDELVREQVLLALPLRTLCRTDCRGLCPSCGGDRNESDCECEGEEDVDPRLAPLLELRRQLKDE